MSNELPNELPNEVSDNVPDVLASESSPESAGEFVRFCKVADVPAGSKKAAKINDTWVLVCHTSQRLFAVSNICSHQYKPLMNGRMRNCTISCPVHGAKFNLETGAALDLPATKPIPTYELRVVDDWIEVRL